MHCLHQFTSRLRDLLQISRAQSGRIHQISTHSQSKCPSGNVVGSVRSIQSARWNQGSVQNTASAP